MLIKKSKEKESRWVHFQNGSGHTITNLIVRKLKYESYALKEMFVPVDRAYDNKQNYKDILKMYN